MTRENVPTSSSNLMAKLQESLDRVKPIEPEHAAVDRDAARRHHLRRNHFVLNCGVPETEIDKVLAPRDRLKPTDAMAAVEEFRASGKRLLVLGGPVGVGKTLAAAAFLVDGPPKAFTFGRDDSDGSWPADRHPRFIPATEFTMLDMYEASRIKPYLNCSILVFDDLGQEYFSDSGVSLSKLEALIYAREQRLGWTIITTNLLVGQFRERYGERICDRINGAGYFAGLTGTSLRVG